MAARTAARRGRSVVLLDHADEPGKKILISGGGRCNFTHMDASPAAYICSNRHFVKSALSRFRPADFLELVNGHRIAWHEKTPGQLFCDGSARQIVEMLVAECPEDRVSIRLGTRVGAIRKGEDFEIETSHGTITAGAVVISTGGLSIPKLGATAFAYNIAKQFGLPIVPTRPGLVPLVMPAGVEAEAFRELAGVSLPVRATLGRQSFSDSMLITHRGLSGPAMLQISSYWRNGVALDISLMPNGDAALALKGLKKSRPRIAVSTALSEILPSRLARHFAVDFPAQNTLANITDRDLSALGARLNRWSITPGGTEGYAKAEVTCGGVDTASLSSQTMEVKSVPGLYFIGEAVDVTGWLGGYNFQWAWASGFAAGEAIGSRQP